MINNQEDWKNKLQEMVFSTDENFKFNTEDEDTLKVSEQVLIAKLEKKGRGGKTVCIIEGFIGTQEELKILAKELKTHCGTGGSVKNNTIIIQGNVRDKIMDYLTKKGYQVKRVGG
ncbi:MAG: translation initiation factor [Flavobacteriales bacterium]